MSSLSGLRADEVLLPNQSPDAVVYPRESVGVGAFPHSILFPGTNVSMKVGGFAKFDFIQDFNSIGSTDDFDTTTIPTSGPQKRNTRLHARQTRLNLDVRHPSELGDVQVFAEGDFFGTGNTFRLRHGFGKLGPVLAGQTWSTFMDEAVMPDLVDFESPTGALLTRRALLRWTQPLPAIEGLEYSLAVEDPSPAFTSTAGTFENALPDFIGRLRFQRESVHVQLAGFATKASFDPTVGADSEATAWGVSLSGSLKVFESDKIMGQVSYGDGIERFRGFSSYTLDASGSLIAIPALACYVGYEHVWSNNLKSVLAYSRATINNPSGAAPTAGKSTDYFAANILWTPVERVRLGLEYLHGAREDEDASRGDANRLQFAIWYYLP
ncbi:MAG: DcaP family trimeric outer membrane transporter [Planctomycetaceae bacterium]